MAQRQPHNVRRAARESAVRDLNVAAKDLGVDPIPVRATGDTVARLYSRLLEAGLGPLEPQVVGARRCWEENGGAALATDAPLEPRVTGTATQDAGGSRAEEDDGLPAERTDLDAHTQKIPGRDFRLCSKAFMLTFNNKSWSYSKALWKEFRGWVAAKSLAQRASYWSATLEDALGW